MQGTARLIQNCTVSSQKKSIGYTAASLNGEHLFFSPSDMTPCIVPSVIIKWSSWELYYNHKRVPLEEMYENVMSKSRGKRSSA